MVRKVKRHGRQAVGGRRPLICLSASAGDATWVSPGGPIHSHTRPFSFESWRQKRSFRLDETHGERQRQLLHMTLRGECP